MSPEQHAGGSHATVFSHEALIYGSDEEFLAVAVPFLRDGLSAGDPTMIGVDARRRQLVLDELRPVSGLTQLGSDHYREPLSVLRDNYILSATHVRDGARRIRILGGPP